MRLMLVVFALSIAARFMKSTNIVICKSILLLQIDMSAGSR